MGKVFFSLPYVVSGVHLELYLCVVVVGGVPPDVSRAGMVCDDVVISCTRRFLLPLGGPFWKWGFPPSSVNLNFERALAFMGDRLELPVRIVFFLECDGSFLFLLGWFFSCVPSFPFGPGLLCSVFRRSHDGVVRPPPGASGRVRGSMSPVLCVRRVRG